MSRTFAVRKKSVASQCAAYGQRSATSLLENAERYYSRLTHLDDSGKASMVEVSEKEPTIRAATASGRIILGKKAFQLVSLNQISKGDVFTVAKIAGINAAKHTGTLIPLCHTIPLSGVKVELKLNEEMESVDIIATASTVHRTGVEMEAMTAVSVSALTVYDMCKSVSKEIVIEKVQLEEKRGGKSGPWSRIK